MSKIRDIDLKPCAFANMHKLRYLNFYVSSFGDANKVHVSEDHEFDFTELRYLSWHGCPMKSLLSSFLPENLVKLDMSNSKIEQLWNGVQHCAKLKEINFGGSSITICPDLSGFPNLKRLYLYNCKYLHEISSSIQDLDKLDFLQLSLCSNLEILPEMPCNLESLLLGNSHKGDAMVCWFLPRIVGCHNLIFLDISYCGITNLPDLDCLSSLTDLYLDGNSFESIPTSIINLSNLERLNIDHCKKLKSLPALQLLKICAFGCTSLEVLQCLPIFKNNALFTYMRFSYSAFNGHLYSEDILYADFGNCCKLDPNISEDIVKDAIRKIQYTREYSVLYSLDDKAAVVDAFICYPGSEIPEWFKFRSNESFINVELPPDWFDYNYAGFVLSVVVAPCLDHQDDEVEYWRIEWNCNLKPKDGDPCVRTGLFYVDINEEQDIRSNHVFVYSCVNISPSELLFCDNEITFQFYIRHDMKQQYKVEKCGVHLIFAQHREEVNGSSRIREDEDVLSLANVHDKCEEEDELIKMFKALCVLNCGMHVYLKEAFLLDSVGYLSVNCLDLDSP
ncbi:hypothetical protein EZV62_003879 [Acer yangbiense]|uniref:C-JID domain-containing protein n=1 Tax=Acer yangbiense TaxID=1000413 RepID=A0A5C7IJ56_9ROSI|nr:hypothetical protein EZV62_003879 [Acer yangbiense]